MTMYFVVFLMGIGFMGAILIPIISSLKEKLKKIEKKNKENDGEECKFQDNSLKLASAVKKSSDVISLSSHDNLVSGKNQIGIIKSIESTIDENVNVAADIVEKTNSIASITSKMEEEVRHGFLVLEKNVKKMEDIKEKNSGVINGIISLSNKVNKIRDIVRIITTITDQTKVIAFNAALEAASSGETGKRFSVVAGEVNRLADDIAGLTRQIREQVEEIQSSSSSLIVYSEDGSDRIAEGHKLIKDLENIFLEIRSAAEITSNQVQTITVSTQKQLKSSEQIHSEIADVSQRVIHFIGASESVAATAGLLTEQTNELERFLTQDEHGD